MLALAVAGFVGSLDWLDVSLLPLALIASRLVVDLAGIVAAAVGAL
jgi:hypothetical protein